MNIRNSAANKIFSVGLVIVRQKSKPVTLPTHAENQLGSKRAQEEGWYKVLKNCGISIANITIIWTIQKKLLETAK